jgi:hypothetical protein
MGPPDRAVQGGNANTAEWSARTENHLVAARPEQRTRDYR